MANTYEYNGEQFSHDDMLEAYGDDAGIQQAIEKHGIVKLSDEPTVETDNQEEPKKKKAVVQKGAGTTVKKSTASKSVNGFSASPKVDISKPIQTDLSALGGPKPKAEPVDLRTKEFKKQEDIRKKAEANAAELDIARSKAKMAKAAVVTDKHYKEYSEAIKPSDEFKSSLDKQIQDELAKDGTYIEYQTTPKMSLKSQRQNHISTMHFLRKLKK